MIAIETKIYLDLGSGWVRNYDVAQKPPPTWEYGLLGYGPNDIVASTGFATFYLDNSETNSEGLPGLYSPAHDDALAGFAEGIPVKIVIETIN